ncbi:type VI immunity family protein [Streptomyces sp. NPDC056921]|uniref:type VI immunity family protein n=1 Tax=Streptomyces sp. NPDC056921 TaxID=3345966 RepID=UPI003624E8E1
MDSFVSVSSGLSHDLVMELTIYDENLDGLSAAAFGWLTEGVSEAAIGGEIGRLQHGLRVSMAGFSRARDSVPMQREGGLWGFVSVSPRSTFDVLYNPYVEEVLPWLMSHLSEKPESVDVKIGEFTGEGDISNSVIRLSASFDEELPNYVKLVFRVDEAVLVNSDTAQTEHSRLLAAVRWACSRYNVVFGHFSYAHSGGRTELESYLRGPVRVPSCNTPNWRERLRGYSWLTVASEDIVRHLGGVDALRESGAFSSISVLPNNSLLLQATPWFHEYRDERVEAVHRALRAMLIEGEFRRPARAPGQPSTHMVLFDKAGPPGGSGA